MAPHQKCLSILPPIMATAAMTLSSMVDNRNYGSGGVYPQLDQRVYLQRRQRSLVPTRIATVCPGYVSVSKVGPILVQRACLVPCEEAKEQRLLLLCVRTPSVQLRF